VYCQAGSRPFVVGMALLAVEIAIIGYSNEPPLQAIYLVLGGAITVVALGWLAEAGLMLHYPSIDGV
jgi:hypothetical protein